MTSATEFQADVDKVVTNFDRVDQFVNSNGYVQTDVGLVPSFPKQLLQYGDVTVARARAEAAADAAAAYLFNFPSYYVGASGGQMPSVPFGAIQNQTIDPAVSLVRTTGATGGFVNVNPSLTDAEIAAHPLVRIKDQAGRRFERDMYQLDDLQLGAGVDNADATNAHLGYRNFALSQAHDVPGQMEPMSRIARYLKGGSHRVTQSGAWLSAAYQTKRNGLKIHGEGSGLTQVIFAPTDGGSKALIENYAFAKLDLRGYSVVTDDPDATFLRQIVDNTKNLNPQRVQIKDVEFDGSWGYVIDLDGDNNNSEFTITNIGGGGGGVTTTGSMKALLRLRQTGSQQFLNYWLKNLYLWLTDIAHPSCVVDAGVGGHIHVSESDFSGWQNGTLFKLGKNGFGAFSVSRTRMEAKTDQVRVIDSAWSGGYVAFHEFDAGPSYSVARATVTHRHRCNPGPDIVYDNCKVRGTMEWIQNPDPGYNGAATSNQGHRHRQSITLRDVQFPEFEDIFDAFKFTTGNANGTAQPVGGLPLIRLEGCHGLADLITGTQWNANTAYAVGTVMQNGGAQYICIAAGTSASSGRGPLTKSPALADGSVVWAWRRNDPRCYVTDTVLNWHTVPAAEGVQERIAALAVYNGGWPSIADAPAQIILPPNALITGAGLWLPPGATSYAGPAKLSIRTDNGALTMIDGSTVTGAAADAGVDLSWSGRFNVSTNLGNRCIWLDPLAGLNANIVGGRAWVRYIA